MTPTEAPTAPETVAATLIAAASAPPPRPRRTGAARVAGHDLCERLLGRRGWRPAGNSRRFWARVEADDPFLPQLGTRPVDESATVAVGPSTHEVYAADRLSRT
ncbi:MAG: hypothetical protein ABMB14_10625, partial [Myxococcota bacterium]